MDARRPFWVLLLVIVLLYYVATLLSSVQDAVSNGFQQFFLGVPVQQPVFIVLSLAFAVAFCVALYALLNARTWGYWLLLALLAFNSVQSFVAFSTVDEVVAANRVALVFIGMQEGAVGSDVSYLSFDEQEDYLALVKVMLAGASFLEGVVSVVLLLFVAGKRGFFYAGKPVESSVLNPRKPGLRGRPLHVRKPTLKGMRGKEKRRRKARPRRKT